MRLVTFTAVNESRIGVWQADGTVLDLTDDPQLPRDMAGFVALGTDGLAAAAALADSGSGTEFGAVTLDAPVRPRNNVMAVGRNYHEHALEFTDSGFDASEKEMIPDHPIIFTKAVSSIIGPDVAIELAHDPSGTSDYEIGRAHV